VLGGLPGLHPLRPAGFRELAEGTGHVVVDLRDQLAFGGGHVPGSLGLGIDDLLSTWAGWSVPPDKRILLLGDPGQDLTDGVRALVRVGLDDIDGFLEGGFSAWVSAGYPIATLPQLPVRELERRLAAGEPLTLLDVRDEREWQQAHVAGAAHVPGGAVVTDPSQAPAGPLAVVCGGGYRSTVVASALQRAGRQELWNVTGGMGAWKRAGLPLARNHQEAPR
jgi:hydroxyacylglutathione hydrolase